MFRGGGGGGEGWDGMGWEGEFREVLSSSCSVWTVS